MAHTDMVYTLSIVPCNADMQAGDTLDTSLTP